MFEADDGLTALAAMRKSSRPFDCVLLDSVMTEMHGPEAARKMRTEVGFRNPIIALTGNTLPEDIDYLMQCGVDLVLTKPISRDKLFESMLQLKVFDSPH